MVMVRVLCSGLYAQYSNITVLSAAADDTRSLRAPPARLFDDAVLDSMQVTLTQM